MEPNQLNQHLEEGIVYVATGQKYITEAIFSATSCKVHNKYPLALITDNQNYELPDGLFDIIIVKEAEFTYKDKLLLRYSPFKKSIFLDTDTYIADSLKDLFRILDFREFAIHQADEGYEFSDSMPEVSNAMPEFNTGVIAFKLTPNVADLIQKWGASFNLVKEIRTDQFHLRKTLYQSEVKFAIFSSAYNFITYYPNFVIQKVKVLHGRPIDRLPGIAANLNRIRHSNAWRRTYFPYNNDFALVYQNLKNEDILKLLRFHTRAFAGNIYRHLFKKKNK